MKYLLLFVSFIMLLLFPFTYVSAAEMDHSGHDMTRNEHADHSSMDHSAPSGTYEHKMVVDGIRVEFQVMSLASMNMKDPEGNTHHIMVKFFHDKMNHQLKDAVGKIKIISPSKKEHISTLNNYSGIFAANFTFNEQGKWGVISLFKIDGEKHVAKFWYPHK